MMLQWLYGAAVLLCVIAAARIAFLLLFRRPARARTHGTDLTDVQRRHDRALHRRARHDGRASVNDVPVRTVIARLGYVVDGIEYRADLRQIADKGAQPARDPVIWYDPADPRRATTFGIRATLTLPLIAGALAVLGHGCGD